jgi:hypothetical protein
MAHDVPVGLFDDLPDAFPAFAVNIPDKPVSLRSRQYGKDFSYPGRAHFMDLFRGFFFFHRPDQLPLDPLLDLFKHVRRRSVSSSLNNALRAADLPYLADKLSEHPHDMSLLENIWKKNTHLMPYIVEKMIHEMTITVPGDAFSFPFRELAPCSFRRSCASLCVTPSRQLESSSRTCSDESGQNGIPDFSDVPDVFMVLPVQHLIFSGKNLLIFYIISNRETDSFSPLYQQDFHDIVVYNYELQPVKLIVSELFYSRKTVGRRQGSLQRLK